MFNKIKTIIKIFKDSGIYTLINYIFVKIKIPIFFDDIQKKNIEKFLKFLKVYDVGFELIRIGPNGDGGYLVPNILKKIKYCFSPGVGNSFTFEDELLLKYNIKSFLTDGSIKNIVSKHDFLNKNLSNVDNDNEITLTNWVNQNVNDEKGLILQMDIEGSEIEVIFSTPISTIKKFDVMIIEFHDFVLLKSKNGFKIYYKLFEYLLREHTVCHIHPNNMLGEVKIQGYLFPKTAEFTFIRNDLIKKKNITKHELPHKLDITNYKLNPDIKLSKKIYL